MDILFRLKGNIPNPIQSNVYLIKVCFGGCQILQIQTSDKSVNGLNAIRFAVYGREASLTSFLKQIDI